MSTSIPHKRARWLAAAAAAVALSIAGPAQPAAAQELDQLCRDAEVVPGACTGITKLSERAAAECRRAGVPEESCVLPMSRRVLRKEVAAYQGSWLQRTLAFQYRLGHTLPLRDAPWIGTHNSFNSTSEAPTLSTTDSNQQLSLVQQLEIDVRSLEIDVHWLPSPHAAGQPAPVVCHGRGADQLHAGCTTERLLADVLDDIGSWLRRNPREVLLLYVEDNVDAAEGYGPTAAVLAEGLRNTTGRSLIYRPPAGASCSDLPLGLTRADVLAAGRQVVLVGGGCGQGAAWPGLVFDWNDVHVESRARGYRDAPVCDQDPDNDGRPEFDPATYASQLVRYYEDSTWISRAAEPTGLGSPDDGLTPETVGRMQRCGVELFGFDQLLPRDGRHKALAWSWARGEPSAPDACAVQRSDSRWISQPCVKRYRAACRRPDGSWRVSAARVRAAGAASACEAEGGAAALPRTAAENHALHQAAQAAGAPRVWLPA